MTAPAIFAHPVLPLDGLDPADRPTKSAAVEGETFQASPQYRRLFGMVPPHQAMAPPVDCIRDGPPASLPATCDPSQAGELFLSQALLDVARLRARHAEKGHTPEGDAAHGWVYFKRISDQAFRDGVMARCPVKRRNRLITAVAILVALIDCEDFSAQQRSSE